MSASAAVSVVKHRDPFQLICPFDTSILKFYWVDPLPAPRWLCDERCEQSGAWQTDVGTDEHCPAYGLSLPSSEVKWIGMPFPS
jgi:hypothetical protein